MESESEGVKGNGRCQDGLEMGMKKTQLCLESYMVLMTRAKNLNNISFNWGCSSYVIDV